YDDICAPSYLQRCVEVLETHGNDVVLAYPKTILIDPAGEPLQRYEDRMNLHDARPSVRLRRILRDLMLCHCALGLIRTAALARTDRIRAYMGSDKVMVAQLGMIGKFYEVDEYLYYRRVHPESSFKVNATPREYVKWMDTSKHPWISLPYTKLFYELFRAVLCSSLSVGEKARCLVQVLLWNPAIAPMKQALGTVLPTSLVTGLKHRLKSR
ncbi:MAG: hypothetical protein R3284_12950, partial [Rubricoccaceae bacterium]|nr:hypothetical protein [Rubricoccaceae bacterium]